MYRFVKVCCALAGLLSVAAISFFFLQAPNVVPTWAYYANFATFGTSMLCFLLARYAEKDLWEDTPTLWLLFYPASVWLIGQIIGWYKYDPTTDWLAEMVVNVMKIVAFVIGIGGVGGLIYYLSTLLPDKKQLEERKSKRKNEMSQAVARLSEQGELKFYLTVGKKEIELTTEQAAALGVSNVSVSAQDA